MAEYTDKDITCKGCKQPFTFTAGEQAFYAERQFSDPVRCKPCREQRKAQKEADDGGGNNGYSRR